MPVRGGLVGLLAFSAEAGYWQFSPRPAGAANAGSAPGCAGCSGAGLVGVVVAADAVSLPESLLVMTTVATTAPITTIAATAEPMIV